MDHATKKAMMEFIEPGSSIPLESLINHFAELCNETFGACFYITRNVKTKKWRVQLTAVGKSFIDDSLRKCIIDAGEFVFSKRYKADKGMVIKSLK